MKIGALKGKRYQTKRRRKRETKWEQGTFIPKNLNKYKKPFDKYMNENEFPTYRSSWELKFMKWCDENINIEYWTSEPFFVPYINPRDGQKHRYFADFLVKFKDGRKFLIEIKPQNQTNDPINLAKWEAAEKFCEKHNLTFSVLTEKELGIKR